MAEALREQGGGGAGCQCAARMPDLVLVDGGKGQVAMAREVFERWGWTCR
jgi:excinuclease ABC subunit C